MSLHDVLPKIYHLFFRYALLKEHIKRGLAVGKYFAIQDGVIIDNSHDLGIQGVDEA